MNLHEEMILMGDRAVTAGRELAKLSTKKKNAILEAMADELLAQKEAIQEAKRDAEFELEQNAGRGSSWDEWRESTRDFVRDCDRQIANLRRAGSTVYGCETAEIMRSAS